MRTTIEQDLAFILAVAETLAFQQLREARRELHVLDEHREQARQDWEAKRTNSCCAHANTRGWRLAIGEQVLPRVYNIHDLKKEHLVDRRFRYITPSGIRLDVHAFHILCNELVDKARSRKNAEAVA